MESKRTPVFAVPLKETSIMSYNPFYASEDDEPMHPWDTSYQEPDEPQDDYEPPFWMPEAQVDYRPSSIPKNPNVK